MAVDIYLEMAGMKTGPVKGESLSQKYADHIEVMKVNFGATSPEDAATKQATGKVRVDDLEFDTQVSQATSAIISMQTGNEVINKCIFKYRKASGTSNTEYCYMKVSLDKARISSVAIKTENEKQVMTIKIGYAKLLFEYFKQKQDGSIDKASYSATYDAEAAK